MAATRSSLLSDLTRLGVRSGGVVMVHASMRTVGPVRGGVNVMIQALLDALGPEGTLAAYLDFEPFFEDGDDVEVPVFDKRIAHAARDHGILHEAIRTWPGAIRSDHPDAGVAAIGKLADGITRDHPFRYGYGPGSPLEKLVQSGTQVLMLGCSLDTITLLHYAEHIAQIPDKRIHRYRRLMPGPNGPEWIDFEEFDTSEPVNDQLPDDAFEQIAHAYLASGQGAQGPVGNSTATLFDGPSLVRFATDWLQDYFKPPASRRRPLAT